MLHSGCVKLHQKFRDFVGLPMGLLREGSPKNRMNTGLFGSRIGEYGLKAARLHMSGGCPAGASRTCILNLAQASRARRSRASDAPQFSKR